MAKTYFEHQFEQLDKKLDKIIDLIENPPKSSRNRSRSSTTEYLKVLIDERIKKKGYITIYDKPKLIAKSGVSERTWYRVLSNIPRFTHDGRDIWAYEIPSVDDKPKDENLTIESIRSKITDHAKISDYDVDTAEFLDEIFEEIGEQHRVTTIGETIMKVIGEMI